jgi:hypothetical protein
MPAAIPIEVSAEQQRELQRIVTAKTSSQRDVFRARIILGLASRDSAMKRYRASRASASWRLVAGGSVGRPRAWKGLKTFQGEDENRQ